MHLKSVCLIYQKICSKYPWGVYEFIIIHRTGYVNHFHRIAAEHSLRYSVPSAAAQKYLCIPSYLKLHRYFYIYYKLLILSIASSVFS